MLESWGWARLANLPPFNTDCSDSWLWNVLVVLCKSNAIVDGLAFTGRRLTGGMGGEGRRIENNNCILTDVFTWSLSGFWLIQFSACSSKSAKLETKGLLLSLIKKIKLSYLSHTAKNEQNIKYREERG